MARYHEESFKFEDLAPADAGGIAPPANDGRSADLPRGIHQKPPDDRGFS